MHLPVFFFYYYFQMTLLHHCIFYFIFLVAMTLLVVPISGEEPNKVIRGSNWLISSVELEWS